MGVLEDEHKFVVGEDVSDIMRCIFNLIFLFSEKSQNMKETGNYKSRSLFSR